MCSSLQGRVNFAGRLIYNPLHTLKRARRRWSAAVTDDRSAGRPRSRGSIAALAALAAVSVALGARFERDPALPPTAPFDATAILSDAATLADARFEGRGPGTAGIDAA